MDYQTIYGDVMESCHHKTTETDLLAFIKRRINERYHRIWQAVCGADPTFSRGTSTLTTVDDYRDGTVTTDGTTTVTGSGTSFAAGMVGRKFKLGSWDEVYTIESVGSTTEITLASAVNADDDSGVSYVIYDDELSLPSDCNEVICLTQEISHSAPLIKIGLEEMRSKQAESPFTSTEIQYNDPQYWTYKNLSTVIVWPAPSRQINIKLDYTKKITNLSDPEDEPYLPIDFHDVLYIGGRVELLKYDDDPAWKEEELEFNRMIGTLKAKNAGNTDLPSARLKVRRT